jgi:hypothetical protein
MTKKLLPFDKKNGEGAGQFADRMNAKFGQKIEANELFANL